MYERETVTVFGVLVGIFSAAITGLVWLVAYGRRIGKFEQAIIDIREATEKRLTSVEESTTALAKAMTALREYHDADMKEVREFFRTPSGGQKFMTFPDHDVACERNNRLAVQQFQMINDLLRGQTAELAKLSAEVSALSTAVAILQDRRVAWRPAIHKSIPSPITDNGD